MGRQWIALWLLLVGVAVAGCAGEHSASTRTMTLDLGHGESLKLVLISAGKFTMGSPESEKTVAVKGAMAAGLKEDEARKLFAGEVQHEVTISKPFYLGVTPVTVDQFAAFVKDSGYKTEAEKQGGMGFEIKHGKLAWQQPNEACNWRKPSFEQQGDHPVVQVNWTDAQEFCDWLSDKSGLTVLLPTEEQWEYACRAGTRTAYPWGDNPDDGRGWANCADLSFKKKLPNEHHLGVPFSWDDGYAFTSPAGRFKPNAFGLYDMCGNVCQWCRDHYVKGEVPVYVAPGEDDRSEDRVLRGGDWRSVPWDCRVAFRWGKHPIFSEDYVGFRVMVLAGEASGAGSPAAAPAAPPTKPDGITFDKQRLCWAQEGRYIPEFNGFNAVSSTDSLHYAFVEQGEQRGQEYVCRDGQAGLQYKSIHSRSLVFSPDCQHLAYFASKGDKVVAVVDGREGAEFDDFPGDAATFSPDSKRVAYVVANEKNEGKEDKQLVVVDGQAGPEYDKISSCGWIYFSPDSKRVAYTAKKGKKELVVVGGQGGPDYDEIKNLAFSPDSKHIVYLAKKGEKELVILDGKAGPEYKEAFSVVFSPDGKRLAYEADKDGKVFLVLDGKEGPEYDMIMYFVFSPDSKRVAYWAKKGEKWRVVLDGQAGPEYDDIHSTGVFFSPDNKHVLYAADKGGKWIEVVDGVAGPEYEYTSTPIFSPDGKHIVYEARKAKKRFVMVVDGKEGPEYEWTSEPVFSSSGGHLGYQAQRGEKSFMVQDGQEGPAYDYIGSEVTISPDGKRMAYVVNKGETQFVVLDGQPGPQYRKVAGPPVFSPDSKHLAYWAKKGVKWLVVADGQAGPKSEDADAPLLFSPDSAHLAYLVTGEDKRWLVLDGRLRPESRNAWRPIFNADSRLEFLAAQGEDLLRLKQNSATKP